MNVAVLGVREQGRAIAQRCVASGCSVRLWADDATAVMDAVDHVKQQLTESTTKQASTQDNSPEAALEGTTGLEAALTDSDLVIETATEDVGELQRQFAAIEKHIDDEAVILTGNPEQSITAATAGMRHPERALGIQFVTLNDTPLIEVVVTEQQSQRAIETVERFVEEFDATVIFVRDAPGLASTRLSLALEVEAMWLVADGVASVSTVDTFLEAAYNHPTGPLEQADRIGLAKRHAQLEHLSETIGDRFTPPPLLNALVEAGYTGRDAGEGFYNWDGDKPVGEAIEGPNFREPDEAQEPN